MKIQDLINKLTAIADQSGEIEIDGEVELEDNPVMIPPLQANLEILKRATDLPNVYDDEEECCDSEEGTMSFEFDSAPEDAELADIQRLAGVQTQPEVPKAAIIALASDQSFPG